MSARPKSPPSPPPPSSSDQKQELGNRSDRPPSRLSTANLKSQPKKVQSSKRPKIIKLAIAPVDKQVKLAKKHASAVKPKQVLKGRSAESSQEPSSSIDKEKEEPKSTEAPILAGKKQDRPLANRPLSSVVKEKFKSAKKVGSKVPKENEPQRKKENEPQRKK